MTFLAGGVWKKHQTPMKLLLVEVMHDERILFPIVKVDSA